MSIGHWLLYWTGIYPESGRGYGFFSGIGSDLGELAIIGGMVTMLRKHNCHHGGCWRVGRHVVDGTPWCNRHHQEARDRYREIRVEPDRAGR